MEERRALKDALPNWTHLNLPYGLHAELLVLLHLHLLDAVLRENRRGAADGAQVKAAVLLACLGHLDKEPARGGECCSSREATGSPQGRRAVCCTWRERLPLASVMKLPPFCMKLAT